MRHGFIREEQDIKYLILYAMSFFPYAVKEGELLESVMVDDGFGYFEFINAFNSLIESRHVGTVDTSAEPEYIITPKGSEIIKDMMLELPLSVREKTEKAAFDTINKLRRQSMIKTERRQNEDGSFTSTMGIWEGSLCHMTIEMRLATDRQCDTMERNFKDNARDIYGTIMRTLATDGPG